MLAFVRAGDTVIVHSMDRLARRSRFVVQAPDSRSRRGALGPAAAQLRRIYGAAGC